VRAVRDLSDRGGRATFPRTGPEPADEGPGANRGERPHPVTVPSPARHSWRAGANLVGEKPREVCPFDVSLGGRTRPDPDYEAQENLSRTLALSIGMHACS